MEQPSFKNRRILVVDDQQSIHADFSKILAAADDGSKNLEGARAAFFGGDEAAPEGDSFELVHALQGEEGVAAHRKALADDQPFSVAFIDVRMPPGMDGIQTIRQLWDADPDIQTVICTAYSDYSFEDIVSNLGQSDRLLILKKPFDPMEVRQLAEALSAKWSLRRSRQVQLEALSAMNEDLREAEQAAKAASRAKSQFLTNMSHEIRTPLNAMLGYVDFACDDSISSEERGKYEQTIRESGVHLMRILDDVLDLARIESNQTEITEEAVSPLELARDVGRLFLPQTSDKDLGLVLRVEGAVPVEVRTDAARLRQVLLQLVGNAVKFTEHGEIDICLSCVPGPDGDEIRWRVRDCGPGISVENQARVFEVFQQVDNSLTRTSGGLGLGLAIAQRVAGLLGGRIELESEPGKGSTFTMIMPAPAGPRVEVSEYACELDPGAKSVKPRTASAGVTGRVLIVEDVKLNRVLLSKILRKAGADVDSAENGREGVDSVRAARAEGRPFDLILMDMQMPVLDGYEATRELRNEGDRVAIVALTAHAMKGDREKCLAAGCDEYATKPIDREALIDLCRRLLEERRRDAA